MVLARSDKFSSGLATWHALLTGFGGEHATDEREFVDPQSLANVEASMGGAIAPLVAGSERLKAIAVWGTFSKTWLEHMLELERRRLALSGDTPAIVNEKLRGYGELHALFLTHPMLPREVLVARPRLGRLWYGEPEGLYRVTEQEMIARRRDRAAPLE